MRKQLLAAGILTVATVLQSESQTPTSSTVKRITDYDSVPMPCLLLYLRGAAMQSQLKDCDVDMMQALQLEFAIRDRLRVERGKQRAWAEELIRLRDRIDDIYELRVDSIKTQKELSSRRRPMVEPHTSGVEQ